MMNLLSLSLDDFWESPVSYALSIVNGFYLVPLTNLFYYFEAKRHHLRL